MGSYLLYSVSLLLLIAATALYLTRAHWTPLLPRGTAREYLYSVLPSSSSFAEDMEAGLSSDTFDLRANVEGGDARAGLDDAAKQEILAIMKTRRLRFDAARKVYMDNKFRAAGIAPDGRPRDPKFVSFS
jgi:hypothetical protein